MKRRGFVIAYFIAIAVAIAVAITSAACNQASLTQSPPCSGEECPCEADPTQPRCRGYNDRPDGTVFPDQPFDSGIVLEAGDAETGADASDANDDG